jgi:hypothetical protein
VTLEVDTEALRAHANDVQHFADQIDGALDAGATTALADEAFGRICSFLVPLTSTVQAAGVGALGTSALTTIGIASGLRSTAAVYDTVDDLTHGALSELIAKLPS